MNANNLKIIYWNKTENFRDRMPKRYTLLKLMCYIKAENFKNFVQLTKQVCSLK